MTQLTEQDLQAIRKLSPMWQPLKPLLWRNPLGYQLALIEQPQSTNEQTNGGGNAPHCALRGCRYALYRPNETEPYQHCISHRQATALVVNDAVHRHQQHHTPTGEGNSQFAF